MKIHKEGRSIIINQFILLFIVGIISNFNSNFITYYYQSFCFDFIFSLFLEYLKENSWLKMEKYYHHVMVKL